MYCRFNIVKNQKYIFWLELPYYFQAATKSPALGRAYEAENITMPMTPPKTAGEARIIEAKIRRSFRIAFMAMVLMSLGSLLGISSLATNAMMLLAFVYFIRVAVLDKKLAAYHQQVMDKLVGDRERAQLISAQFYAMNQAGQGTTQSARPEQQKRPE